MFSETLGAFATLLEWPNPLLIIAAGMFGFSLGIVPGLGGSVVMVLLLPLTVDMSPETAVIVLMAGYGVVGTGGMVTSVLLNTPGTAENAATTLDGYPLARQGRAREALGAGAAASTWGAMVGLAALFLLLPFARPFVLSLSYPDFLMLGLLGLSLIAVITRGQAYRAIVSAALGLMLSFVGLDPMVGRPRFTFGQLALWDGIPLVPALIGLFAVAELLALYGSGKNILELDATKSDDSSSDSLSTEQGRDSSTFAAGFLEVTRHPLQWVRGGLIGTVIGIVPAVGGVVASFLSYAQAQKFSKRPELFGKGSIEGITAAESANDAKEAGAMVPTLLFGIPGSIGTAIVLAALLFHGIPAGPSLMRDNSTIIYLLLAAMIASKIITPFFVWLVSTRVAWLSSLRIELIVPILTVVLFAGTYSAAGRNLDIVFVLAFGYLGYGMERFGLSRIAFVIAFVLGPLLEASLQQTKLTFGSVASALQRPIAGTLFLLTVLVLAAPTVAAIKKLLGGRGSTARDNEIEAVPSPGHPQAATAGSVFFSLVLITVAAVLLWQARTDLRGAAAEMPSIAGFILLAGLALMLSTDLWRLWGGMIRSRHDESREATPTQDGEITAATGYHRDLQVFNEGVSNSPALSDAPIGEANVETEKVLIREISLAAWGVSIFVLSTFIGLLYASTIGLLVFFLAFNRDRWFSALTKTFFTILVVYILFVRVLGAAL